jgi:hypothetical protein
MNATPGSEDHVGLKPLPEVTIAGDVTILALVAAVVAGLIFWRRRTS